MKMCGRLLPLVAFAIALFAFSQPAYCGPTYLFSFTEEPDAARLTIETNLGELVLSTANGSILSGHYNQGWWGNDAFVAANGPNTGRDNNYFAGDTNGDGTEANAQIARDFFTFAFGDTSNLPPITLTSATLSIDRDAENTDGVPALLTLYDVSTDASTLNHDGASQPNDTIFNDLGSGNSYGNVVVTGSDSDPVVITLDAQALTDFAAALTANSGFFSIGGSVTAAPSDAPASVPEPATMALFGSGLLLVIRRKRAA